MSQSSSLKDKIKMLFCAKPPNSRDRSPIVYKKQHNRKEPVVKKQTRQTLNFDDVFLKLSRKNIVEEQFFTNEVLNLQLEKHIGGRVKGAAVGLIRGQFTEETTQTIKVPIFVNERPVKTIPYREQIKSDSMLKIRENFVDLVIYQTDQTYAAQNPKKPKLKNQQIIQKSLQIDSKFPSYSQSEQANDVVKVIQAYYGLVDYMVIVCSKNIDPLEYSSQLMQFSTQYLFQLERVRQNQELVCNIIYLSKTAYFLKLNDKSFKEMILAEMNMTLEEEAKMAQILSKFIQYKLHRELLCMIRQIKKETFGNRSLFEPFIIRASNESERMKKIIVDLKDVVFEEENVTETPVLNEPTPLFKS